MRRRELEDDITPVLLVTDLLNRPSDVVFLLKPQTPLDCLVDQRAMLIVEESRSGQIATSLAEAPQFQPDGLSAAGNVKGQVRRIGEHRAAIYHKAELGEIDRVWFWRRQLQFPGLLPARGRAGSYRRAWQKPRFEICSQEVRSGWVQRQQTARHPRIADRVG